ncbi:hypothetical protein GQX74_012813 [Glossina fuscipes]|nr:hypothetical protein GQX74_012813 [Glossina fuscipes]
MDRWTALAIDWPVTRYNIILDFPAVTVVLSLKRDHNEVARLRKAAMVMVSSAVLGAAIGSGLALMVAVTIVMYRYYLLRRRGKEWDELDRWEETRILRKLQLRFELEESSVCISYQFSFDLAN